MKKYFYRFAKSRNDATSLVKALEQLSQADRLLIKENDTEGALHIEYFDGTSWNLYGWWR